MCDKNCFLRHFERLDRWSVSFILLSHSDYQEVLAQILLSLSYWFLRLLSYLFEVGGFNVQKSNAENLFELHSIIIIIIEYKIGVMLSWPCLYPVYWQCTWCYTSFTISSSHLYWIHFKFEWLWRIDRNRPKILDRTQMKLMNLDPLDSSLIQILY